MKRETMMLASELKSHLADKLKDSAADGKTKSCAWSDCRSGPEFHVNCGSGRVGSLHLLVGLDKGQENWTHVQLRGIVWTAECKFRPNSLVPTKFNKNCHFGNVAPIYK